MHESMVLYVVYLLCGVAVSIFRLFKICLMEIVLFFVEGKSVLQQLVRSIS